MLLWKETAGSFLLILSGLNSIIRMISGFARIGEGISDEAELEFQINSRAHIQELAKKANLSDADIEALRAERNARRRMMAY